MPIKTGRYIITNVQQRNLVVLADSNDDTPLAAGVREHNNSEQWSVTLHSNGTYSIKNVMHEKSFAVTENRAEVGATVEGKYDRYYWLIKGTGNEGQYTICTIDTGRFWGLEDRPVGTSVTLFRLSADKRCWWTFEDAETGLAAELDKDSTKLPPRTSTPVPFTVSSLFGGWLNRYPSSQPPPDTPFILLDIPFKISESKGLLDPVTSVAKALGKVHSAAEATFASDEGWKIPIRRLRFHLDTIRYHCVELERDFKIDGIVPTPETKIIQPLEKYANHLRSVYLWTSDKEPVDSSVSNIGSKKTRNKGTIGRSIKQMDSAFDKYTTALESFAEREYKKMQELPQIVQNLEVEATKYHNTVSEPPNAYGVQHKECLPGTRQKTIKAIREWANDTSGAKPTFLLLDVAGSGKSTVAKTMAEEFERTRLVARYFFSRDTTTTRSTELFCSTVSDAFIKIDPRLRDLVEKFKDRPDLKLLSFKELFDGLVAGPLESLSLDAILIIDALDECNDEDDSCTQLLNTICSQRPFTPRLRILATGRPELHITSWAKRSSIEWYNFLRLEGNNKDVDLYIEQTLKEFPKIHGIVINLANGVFIWARIACDLIRKTDDVDILLKELEKVVSLDFLYQVALNQSVPRGEGSRRAFAVVLQMILASREPLSIPELEKLAPDPRIVNQIVTRMGALLVYQGREDPIRLLHATFREFLTTRSKSDRYFIQLENGHHTLTLGCLKAIEHSSTQEVSTLDNISQREEISFLTEYTLTVYLGFTFTRQNRGWVTM